MIKLFIKVNIVFCLFITSFAQAALISLDIKDLSQDRYIEYTDPTSGVTYDIAWASTVNTEKYYDFDNGLNFNILSRPGIRTGWGFADDDQLALLESLAVSGELLSRLTRDDQTLIHAFEYWNNYYTAPVGTDNISPGNVASTWVWSFPIDPITGEGVPTPNSIPESSEIQGTTGSFFDTFYFRVQDNSSTPVPEPSTLMIFSLGLIALVSKKKLFS
jgi:hypothetical protein